MHISGTGPSSVILSQIPVRKDVVRTMSFIVGDHLLSKGENHVLNWKWSARAVESTNKEDRLIAKGNIWLQKSEIKPENDRKWPLT